MLNGIVYSWEVKHGNLSSLEKVDKLPITDTKELNEDKFQRRILDSKRDIIDHQNQKIVLDTI